MNNTNTIPTPLNNCFRVTSNHMSPRILKGDILITQSVGINDTIPGYVYVVEHITKGLLIRKVTDQGKTLLLSTYNKGERPALEILKSDVLAVARVVGLVRDGI